MGELNPDPEIRESSSSSCSSSIYWASAPMKEPIFLAIILFRLLTVRILEDDDEHQNEDDFATSEFKLKGAPAKKDSLAQRRWKGPINDQHLRAAAVACSNLQRARPAAPVHAMLDFTHFLFKVVNYYSRYDNCPSADIRRFKRKPCAINDSSR